VIISTSEHNVVSDSMARDAYSSWMTAASALSVVGDLYIIATFFLIENVRHKIYSKLIYVIAISDLVAAIGTLIGTQPTNTPLCIFQSISSTAFHLIAVFWTLVLTQILYKIVVKGQPTKIKMLSMPTVAVYIVFLGLSLLPLLTNQLGHVADGLPGRCFVANSAYDGNFGAGYTSSRDDGQASYNYQIIESIASLFSLRSEDHFVDHHEHHDLDRHSLRNREQHGAGYDSHQDRLAGSTVATFQYSSLFWIMMSYYVWIWLAFVWISYWFICMTIRIRGLFGNERTRALKALVCRQFDKCWPFPIVMVVCWLPPTIVDVYAASTGKVLSLPLAYIGGLTPILHGFFNAVIFYWCNKKMLRSEWKRVLSFTAWVVNGRKIAVTDAYAIVVDLFLPKRERVPEEEAHSMSDIVISAFEMHQVEDHYANDAHGNGLNANTHQNHNHSTIVERYGGPLSLSHTEYVEKTSHNNTHNNINISIHGGVSVSNGHSNRVATMSVASTSRCRHNNHSVFNTNNNNNQSSAGHSEFYPNHTSSEMVHSVENA
jgi:hypothetical protein